MKRYEITENDLMTSTPNQYCLLIQKKIINFVTNKERLAGCLILAGLFTGVFSVAPAIDSAKYLTEAAVNNNQVLVAAICQFLMSLAYIGIAILLYPSLRNFGGSLSVGFLSLRIIAATLVIFGTILLMSVLVLSKEYRGNPAHSTLPLQAIGEVLKLTRDYINHVFMILVLCTGNLMFYTLLLKSKLVPVWLSVWGILGNILSALASILWLFHVVDIITPEYLILNAPTAIQELILGIWLIAKGFDKKLLPAAV